MYGDWLRRTTVGDLCALLERPPAWLDRALLAISDAVALPAVAEGSSRPRSIRLPLGEAGGSALCVWLDVIRRAAGRSARVPSFFWSHDGRLGDALLFLDTPSESTLATLWRVDADARGVRDLTLPTACPEVMGLDPAAGVAGAEADAYHAVGKQTLWHLLDRIEPRPPASR